MHRMLGFSDGRSDLQNISPSFFIGTLLVFYYLPWGLPTSTKKVPNCLYRSSFNRFWERSLGKEIEHGNKRIMHNSRRKQDHLICINKAVCSSSFIKEKRGLNARFIMRHLSPIFIQIISCQKWCQFSTSSLICNDAAPSLEPSTLFVIPNEP